MMALITSDRDIATSNPECHTVEVGPGRGGAWACGHGRTAAVARANERRGEVPLHTGQPGVERRHARVAAAVCGNKEG